MLVQTSVWQNRLIMVYIAIKRGCEQTVHWSASLLFSLWHKGLFLMFHNKYERQQQNQDNIICIYLAVQLLMSLNSYKVCLKEHQPMGPQQPRKHNVITTHFSDVEKTLLHILKYTITQKWLHHKFFTPLTALFGNLQWGLGGGGISHF